MLGLSLAIRVGKRVLGSLIDSLMSAVKGRATYSENIADSKQVVKDIDNYELLDKASILLTPTAYSDARVHSVKTYTGDELVTNGGFNDGLSGWTEHSGSLLELEDGRAKVTTVSSQGYIKRTDLSIQSGNTYFFTAEITNATNPIFFINGVSDFIVPSLISGDTYGGYITVTGDNSYFYIRGNNTSGQVSYIDNVSIIDVSSDFDFDRASSATRINSDGLVQDMQSITDPELVLNGDFEELSSEYITNGDFSDGETGWTKGGAASATQSVVNGALVMYAGSASDANNSLSRTNTPQGYNGKTYKLELTVSDMLVSSTGFIRLDSTYDASNIISFGTGTSTIYFTAYRDFTHIRFFAGSAEDGYTIDNVSVQQVDPNDRWTVANSDADNYVEFTEGFARLKFLNTSPITTLNSTLTLQANKTYELVVDVHDVTSGAIKIDAAGLSELFNTEGVTTRYLTPTGNATLSFYRATANVDITLASVSIKDITFSEDVDLARINYDSNGENGHWLLEPTSTNLVTYSEDFSEWSNVYAILTANQPSPDGFNNAFIIEDEDATAYRKIDETITTTATPHTFSVFIKKKTSAVSSYSGIQMGSGFSYVIFDSYNGTYNQYSNTNYDSVEVEDFNSDWWRLKLTVSVTTSTRVALWGAISTNGTSISASATGSETFYGGQLEALSYATSYIPTYGSTVTRATETLNGSGNSTLINSTEGVLFAEIAALANDGLSKRITISDATLTNRIALTLGDNNISGFINVNNVSQYTFFESITTTNFNKIAIKFKANDFAVWINGVEYDVDTSGITFSANTLNVINFANATNTSNQFYGNCKSLAVFNEALENDELELLTGITNYGSFNELAQANGYTII